ncbi:N-glycosylation protein eos1 [Pleurostoma richardsiae]|uniref:N-glycosylation protein eos1 n=1 Tax=Pleurostoma richardsiae TaxID=41990 RepID=A0AA38S9X3_9PEZI|nr:N-glycosylation protein eos1 [Pleurostoma richardsiae]
MPRPAHPPSARQATAEIDDDHDDDSTTDQDAAGLLLAHHHTNIAEGSSSSSSSSSSDNGHGGSGGSKWRSKKGPLGSVATPRLLQPRVAVVLGVAPVWHPVLFASRLLSVVPAVLWGLPSLLLLLARLAALATSDLPPAEKWSFENRLRLTESLLAIIWCGCSAYLSFFFTDCLMSRWLLNYTPPATIVRLLAINALNGYVTSWVLYLTGGSEDPRLLLPSWIGIATTLTGLYHITQLKINIRKETSTSISVFSIASFISMVSLLAQLHSDRSDFPNIPIIALARRAWHEAGKAAMNIVEYANVTKEL